MSSAVCVLAAEDSLRYAQRPPALGWALRRLRSAATPARTGALLQLFERLRLLQQEARQLRMLVRRARMFTPTAAGKVAELARSDPDAALEAFVLAFQREHFELDESVCDQGFEIWADTAGDFIPLSLRGTDRCNGIDPQGSRPGYALQWALIQDVFDRDDRSQVIAEVALVFGEELADRLEATDQPEHGLLVRRLDRSPYNGIVAFSRWALGDVSNDILFHHAHHAQDVQIPWTRRGVARADRLIREADAFEAPMLALARWLEHSPAEHGPLLVDAVVGQQHAESWSPAAIRACGTCGFPPAVQTWREATSPDLLSDSALHPGATPPARTSYVHCEEDLDDDLNY